MTVMEYSYKTADVMLYTRLREYAKNNRHNQTEAESAIWNFIKAKQLGFPFRRQHIIGTFIADFICLPKHLIIEIDGGYHNLPQQEISDEERSKWLESQGYKVIRFTNEEVLCDIFNVIETIKAYLD